MSAAKPRRMNHHRHRHRRDGSDTPHSCDRCDTPRGSNRRDGQPLAEKPPSKPSPKTTWHLPSRWNPPTQPRGVFSHCWRQIKTHGQSNGGNSGLPAATNQEDDQDDGEQMTRMALAGSIPCAKRAATKNWLPSAPHSSNNAPWAAPSCRPWPTPGPEASRVPTSACPPPIKRPGPPSEPDLVRRSRGWKLSK